MFLLHFIWSSFFSYFNFWFYHHLPFFSFQLLNLQFYVLTICLLPFLFDRFLYSTDRLFSFVWIYPVAEVCYHVYNIDIVNFSCQFPFQWFYFFLYHIIFVLIVSLRHPILFFWWFLSLFFFPFQIYGQYLIYIQVHCLYV